MVRTPWAKRSTTQVYKISCPCPPLPSNLHFSISWLPPIVASMRTLLSSLLFLISLHSIFFNIDVITVSGQCLDDQRSLLLQIKSNFTFDRSISTKIVEWDKSLDCCSWGGVTCDNAGRIIGLSLNSESISGAIDNTSSLFSLQYLQSLNLAYNSFNWSEAPLGFEKLTSLTYLNLSNANFAGQIPIEISRMTRLVILDLSTLHFSRNPSLKLENPNLGMLVRNLTELAELHLDGVDVSAQGNEWCQALSSSLPNLRVLSLSDCHLSGPIDSSLAKLRYLSVVRLDNNNLSTPVPEFFVNFTNLTNLCLSSSELYGTFPEMIFQVTTLQTLDLSSNGLLEGTLPEFPQNSSLQTLVVSNTKFSGSLPNSLGNLQRLSRIELARCNFSGSIPNSLASLPQLVYVDFSSNNFIGPIPSFSSSKSLTHLNLARNRLNGSILSTNWGHLSNLVILDLQSNSLGRNIPLSLFKIPSLQRIQLSHNQFTGRFNEFSNVSSSLLDTLDLSSNRLEGPFPELVFGLKGLKILVLSSNSFSGTIELNLFQQLRNLFTLDLSYNSLSINAYGTNSSLTFFPQISTLKLASCKLGTFPQFLKNQPELTYLDLSDNQIHGEIPNWIWKFDSLLHLNLSYNFLMELEGPLLNPGSALTVLDLHSNQLRGKIPTLPPCAAYLDYSRNNFSSVIPTAIGSNLSLTIFFSLSSNNFHGSIPESICDAVYLRVLDLSNNSLSGMIPHCLKMMSGALKVLILRRNNLNGSISDIFPGNCGLRTLDLNGNILKGQLPESLSKCTGLEVLDLGNNQINDIFPCWLKNISSLRVLVLRSNKFHGSIECPRSNSSWPILQIIYLASNNFHGSIPESICNAMNLHDLDLSNNSLSGMIPHCLIMMSGALQVLNLRRNNLHGSISDTFPSNCGLTALYLNGNILKGQVPKSLANCTGLEVLDLGNNQISDNFPCWLKNISSLHILILRSNKFHGSIGCLGNNSTWPILQIIDLASNNFSGELPSQSFHTWTAMIIKKEDSQQKLGIYAFDMVTVMAKNRWVEIRVDIQVDIQVDRRVEIRVDIRVDIHKISFGFTSVDFSGNMFEGEIPEEVGYLQLLHVLNISHNALTGQIPSSMGNLKQLESLDLSQNKLNGIIPTQLVALTFLSVLNVSFNQLEGMIPTGNQFLTFSEDSFQGNKGLCGGPLKTKCTGDRGVRSSSPTFEDGHSDSGAEIKWEFISAEIGFIFGLGVVIGPLVFWQRWRKWYYGYIDQTVLKILY